ncbi:MMPL family transporter [Dethiobacter alkaliphilus]|uniref:MMPL family transporter n=1 Tax=Dethiobacter alkaliphilus TaxID=427926 RepID=UPI0022274C36|nr:MMPL family transporter [Dethiobacter alkaliphilus]MCW3489490.1 MMPL family transporter [Dethiobacter alkaliphilus]
MDKFADFVIKQKKPIIIVFVVLALICAILFMYVNINYNMVDYLPPEAQSTTALNIMEHEFTQTMPNASVMISNVSIVDAMEYKQKLASIEGITEVLWLDDMMDITQPLAMGDIDTIEGFYKNGNALFSVTIAKGMEQEASVAIREIIGAENALAGEAPDIAAVQQATGAEVLNALIILLPIVIIILVLSTTSWIEPLLFMAAIGISILMNMGTNFFLGEISFMTNSVSPILQLAVSLDYAIFLLHSFAANRRKYDDVEEAMRQSIKESLSTVSASAVRERFFLFFHRTPYCSEHRNAVYTMNSEYNGVDSCRQSAANYTAKFRLNKQAHAKLCRVPVYFLH